ncbi:DUF3352 domain-containing protein [Actinobacteria bacterium YIM 96077]|uniref:DUF3352 domain-containing protein n=1 Tax=Phytoactinopolyspora halophila TaxID=1981511 RepID=A0A329QHU3_9ACTN|nr:DUF3352 domain-containing protein [Phytoactinopolyspora halophila]AYY14378.1 DUF3352 domain-containing protein [Actinobacteria bacterium YIM 96077]RAW11900.1 hypothetical protein DPM12_15680 [Phytoactinopolyspora halophila]
MSNAGTPGEDSNPGASENPQAAGNDMPDMPSGSSAEQPPPPPPSPAPSPEGTHSPGSTASTASVPPPPAPPLPSAGANEPPRRRRRGFLIGALVAAIVLLVPGAVFAWRALDGGGPQPHDVLPADTLGYVRLDLDPSASQKVEASRFLDTFPALDDVAEFNGDEDLREVMVDKMAEDAGCEIDFGQDVEPWLGDRAGMGFLPPRDDGTDPDVVFVMQVNDEDTAASGLETLQECGGGEPEPIPHTFVDGYLILAAEQDLADEYAESARDSSLADNDEFVDAMDRLGDPGIASMWFSGEALVEFADTSMMEDQMDTSDEFGNDPMTGMDPGAPDMDQLREMVEQTYRSIAMTVRFDDEYAEIVTAATGDLYKELPGGGVRADVPEDTTMMFGFVNGNQYLQDNWEFLTESAGEEMAMMENMVTAMGLSLPEDLGTMLGDNLLVAVDANNLDLDALTRFGDMESLRFGMRVDGDPDAVSDVWSTLEEMAAMSGDSLDDVPLTTTDDGYVIASDDAYAGELTEGGTLGETDSYNTAVKDADDAHAVMYLDAGVLTEELTSQLTAEGVEPEIIESIQAIQAFGYSAHLYDGYTEATFRIITD